MGATWESFWAAAEGGDMAGMTASLHDAWVTADANPDDVALAGRAGSMRREVMARRWRWDDDHKRQSPPEVVGVESSAHTAQGPNAEVSFVRTRPKLAPGESNSDLNPTSVILEGGFGTDPRSTRSAAETISMGDVREVITMDHPKTKRGKSGKNVHPDIASYFTEKAENLLAVMEAAADGDPDKQFDLVLQSGAAQGVAAALMEILERDDTRPHRVRSILIDSGCGLSGKDTGLHLLGRFVKDALLGLGTYKKNREQMDTYNKVLVSSIARNGLIRTFKEIRAIARSGINGEPLRILRKHGVKVGILSANSDRVFPVDRVDPNIELDEADEFGNITKYGNADAYAWRSYKKAPHGGLLFEVDTLGMGAMPDVQMLQSLAGRTALPRIHSIEAELAAERLRAQARYASLGSTAFEGDSTDDLHPANSSSH